MLSSLGSLIHTLLVVWLSVGVAPIYKYVDDQGNVTYSNSPRPGAKVIVIEDPSPPSKSEAGSSSSKSSPAASSQKKTTPNSFPRVDTDTQRKRDQARRAILEEELRNEERSLADAEKALKEGEPVRLGNEKNYQKYLDRVQGLKESVTRHRKNVEAIRKELGS